MNKSLGFYNIRYKVIILSGLLVATVTVLLSVILATNRTSLLGRAETKSLLLTFSRENSYVFASPVSALADGQSIIRITVFLLDSAGMGIERINISLRSDKQLNIINTQPVTDSFGRAIFDVTARVSGGYKISAQVEGVSLPQSASISFL